MVFSPKLVKRYKELKEEVSDCLLLMQVGAFMQVMDKDARAVSKVTGLKLQMAGEVDAPVVLGGFPKSGLDAYVGKLARAAHHHHCRANVGLSLGKQHHRLTEKFTINYSIHHLQCF